MNAKRRIWYLGLAAAGVVGLGWLLFFRAHSTTNGKTPELIKPHYGDLRITVATTGDVQPQNRLEIKPPIGGRIEKMLVREGDHVRKGQNLAWMSSTDRAALLDAASSQGGTNTAYWEDVYKPMPVVSPIEGEVIVRAVEPGQTVAAGEAVLVLSDRLIVKAQVDETDIGKIHLGQDAVITLDAYPEIRVPARVDHIAYESKVVNNVTIYEVDVLPQTVPPVFRSGMSANVEVVTASKDRTLLVPLSAVQQGGKRPYVLVSRGEGQTPERRPVELGLIGEQDAEILSGVGPEDLLVAAVLDYSFLKASERKGNPFMPSRRPAGGGAGGSARGH
jgi:membrane fusion protein, macrolide-specific efflux system